MTWLTVLQHLPWAVFVFCFGASVGSFVNVVNHRLPAGMSVIAPPSRCPTCGARLRFIRENLPIVGWLLVRGRCRYCGARISPEYMILELIMALAFLGLFVLLFVVRPTTPWVGGIGDWWWYGNTFLRTWPAFFVWAFLLAGLVSMTVIDARTFTIPIQVPLFVTFAAFAGYALQALMSLRTPPSSIPEWSTWPIQGVSWHGSAIVAGGLLGVLVGVALLWTGRVRYSFADYHEYVKEGEVIGAYPHARREMLRELVFLLPCLLGLGLGWWVGAMLPGGGPPPLVQAVAISGAGYLVGGGMIWGIRILGSLAFGREAMGLGDVHLLAAVGAVLGWFYPILIFFIAPFSGLLWALLSMGLGSIFRGLRRELPYGPHLALATLIMILCRPAIEQGWQALFGAMPWPRPGFVP